MIKYTIGITTYNRKELLKKAVQSIVGQTFGNLELIIGNDYQKVEVSFNDLGIDERYRDKVKIINYPENLGEVGNLNELLSHACGEYFIWLADDDLFDIHLLEVVNNILEKEPSLNIIIPNCFIGESYTSADFVDINNYEIVSGLTYLNNYLMGLYKLQGVYLVFKTSYLKSIGGLPIMSSFATPYYCDGALALFPALEERVCYIKEPLVFFRLHENSLSYTTKDITYFAEAQRNYVTLFKKLFLGQIEDEKFKILFFIFLKSWVLSQFYDVWLRSQRSWRVLISFNLFFFKQIRYLSFSKAIRLTFKDYFFQKKKILRACIKG